MSVRFLIEDTNDLMYALYIDDDGNIGITTPEGDDPDPDVIEALEALGLKPELTENLEDIWNSVTDALVKEGAWNEFLWDVRHHDTEVEDYHRRWPYETFRYTHKFTAPEFAGHLGTAIEHFLKNDDDYAVGIAHLVMALRDEHESALEFSMGDGGWTEEDSGWEVWRQISYVNRSIYADDAELFEYTVAFEREIYDPITFASEVDTNREQWFEVAASHELQNVIELFGLEDEQDKLDKEAEKTAPEPYYPESDKDGDYGVYYRWIEYEKDKKTGDWKDVERETVVPYWGLTTAKEAYEMSKAIIEDHDREDRYPEYYIVERMSEEEQAQLEQAVKEREKERAFWKKQGKLFPVETPLPITFDPETDIWKKWKEEK